MLPSATLREDYSDNVFFSTAGRTSDFRSTISPAVDFSDRSERLEANLHVGFDGVVYARGNGPNSLDQNYRARGRYVLTERTNVSGDATYLVDSQPDRDLTATGLVVTGVKRHGQHYTLGGDYALTQKVMASLSYAYQQDDYDSSKFSNLKYHDVSFTVTHDLSNLLRATKGSVSFDYAHYETSSSGTGTTFGSDVDSFSASIGGSSAFNELWSIEGSLGGRYTVSDYVQQATTLNLLTGQSQVVESRQREDDNGFVGRLAVVYSGESTSGNLAFTSDVQPSSGQVSGTTIRTSVAAQANRRFTYECSGSLGMGYYHNRSNPGAFAGQTIDQDTIIITPGIKYNINKDMFVEAYYQYGVLLNNVANTDADRNIFFVKFYIQYPKLL